MNTLIKLVTPTKFLDFAAFCFTILLLNSKLINVLMEIHVSVVILYFN